MQGDRETFRHWNADRSVTVQFPGSLVLGEEWSQVEISEWRSGL